MEHVRPTRPAAVVVLRAASCLREVAVRPLPALLTLSILWCVGVAVAELALEETSGGEKVLTWDASVAGFVEIEIRASDSSFEEDLSAGALIATLEADPDADLPTSFALPASFLVVPESCIGCGLCISQCPVSAISMVDGKAVIDPSLCIACGLCVNGCAVNSIVSHGSSLHYAVIGIDGDGSGHLIGAL